MNNICFIPAKGNSRRLTRKNMKLVGGKSMLERAIDSAKESGCFSKICVSSNDEEILDIARIKGVIALNRAEQLCAVDFRAKDVLKSHLDDDGNVYDSVTMLMPTSPLRTGKHIKEAHARFLESECNTLVSVTEFQFNPAMAMTINNGALVPFFIDKFKWVREETLPKAYHMNGAIFLSKYCYFMENATFVEKQTVPYVMDRLCSIDVDTHVDLETAELYLGMINDRNN